MSVEDGAREVLAEVGLWWPAADEDALRRAAVAWERMAGALEDAAEDGPVAVEAAASWRGEAATRFRDRWGRQERALVDDAAGCRALASALREYADAVEDAKRRVEQLAITVGATLVAGVALAVFTFGTTAAAAATVSASLVSAAAAIGVELSSTVAAILGGTIAGIGFGAGEAMVVDMAVAQPVRVEAFDDGGYSMAEVGESGAFGGLLGGGAGGVLARTAAQPIARTAAGDLSGLRAPGGRIRGALDPSNWGPVGRRFSPGVDEGQRAFLPHERSTADLLAGEGVSVRSRAEIQASGRRNPDAIVRRGPEDPGVYTEFKAPTQMTDTAVKRSIRDAGDQLEDWGGGAAVVDGRQVGLTREVAEAGLRRTLGEATAHSLPLPRSIRFVLGDGSEFTYP